MNDLAPIVLFVYNRLWHTQKTVNALQKNDLVIDSELFVYSDNARDEKVQTDVDAVRAYIKTITGFKKITIVEQSKNKGLANSIIEGVTEVVNTYGKVIVLEDDLVTSPHFLRFMNDALSFYEKEKRVWHVSGWSYPINMESVGDVFLWRFMNCWGWATWKDRWQYFEKNVDKCIATFSKDDIYRFNLDGAEDFWSHVLANKKGRMNTWAIFWYAWIFKKNGLCINPRQTFVQNIGHDGSGVNCDDEDFFSSEMVQTYDVGFISEITENDIVLTRVGEFYKKRQSVAKRIINGMSKLMK